MADMIGMFLIGLVYLVTVALFVRAFKHKVENVYRAKEDIRTVHTFDFSRSHRLVMEREKIDDMVNQMYREPMDQFFSLQQWKLRVAEYIMDYRNYAEDRSQSCSKVKNLY